MYVCPFCQWLQHSRIYTAGASNALKTGVAAGSQMPLQQPYTAPPTLVVGVLIAAAAVAQLCASAFAAKADS